MFSSIKKMVQEARNARGDIEKQYTLYYRCAQLSKLIYKQNDFAKFKAEVSFILYWNDFHLLYFHFHSTFSILAQVLKTKYLPLS